jgi:hypothetical protein
MEIILNNILTKYRAFWSNNGIASLVIIKKNIPENKTIKITETVEELELSEGI